MGNDQKDERTVISIDMLHKKMKALTSQPGVSALDAANVVWQYHIPLTGLKRRFGSAEKIATWFLQMSGQGTKRQPAPNPAPLPKKPKKQENKSVAPARMTPRENVALQFAERFTALRKILELPEIISAEARLQMIKEIVYKS